MPDSVQAFIDREIDTNIVDFPDLRAVFLNGTLKGSPEVSHTDALIDISTTSCAGVGARVNVVRGFRPVTLGPGQTVRAV